MSTHSIPTPPLPAANFQTPTNPLRFQFSLRMMLLLMAVVGVWTGVLVNWRALPRLEREVALLRSFVRELLIQDPKRFAVVQHDAGWYDEFSWDVYVPHDGFELLLATRQIDQANFPPNAPRVPLPAGKYRLSLAVTDRKSEWQFSVSRDGDEILTATEPRTRSAVLPTYRGPNFRISEQPEMPAALFRCRISKSNAPGRESGNGVLLWIDTAQSPK